ncbi:hypothetical protein Mal15_35170 [Stieleria maiorica]|uniref:Uncharacterized protein n=1 Tax=Stieleria maiorica TaxID=2795974 RepID=A0A5B9MDW7_9BACT|nr:GxxExxY protein [Stieleria maiorica]QEF99452.1 hypothetical protein Mal15_35170 [Stieleria maiorica]
MPIEIGAKIRAVGKREFSQICYDVMGSVFAIRKEMGRVFNESVYHRKIRESFADTLYEVPIVVSHGQFTRRYALDSLFLGAAIFEWKSVDTLCDVHRAQLLNYLMLCEVRSGKLVNLRPEKIEQEFVNVALTRAQRQSFTLEIDSFSPSASLDRDWMQCMIDALRDCGTGLDQGLYLSLSDFFHGGADQSHSIATVTSGNMECGQQRIRANRTGDVIMISTLSQRLEEFERHSQLFLNHLDRDRLHWLNIGLHKVSFRTLHKAT